MLLPQFDLADPDCYHPSTETGHKLLEVGWFAGGARRVMSLHRHSETLEYPVSSALDTPLHGDLGCKGPPSGKPTSSAQPTEERYSLHSGLSTGGVCGGGEHLALSQRRRKKKSTRVWPTRVEEN